ncbi:methyl-accepting chemotaxis protein [Sphingomonadaceae bacterium G21617-S1]|nr:methyl-accepting chemotaxis protein [Sphingomonadaceae bacterium G21617-S1]
MLRWFSNDAPIRAKFNVLITLVTACAGIAAFYPVALGDGGDFSSPHMWIPIAATIAILIGTLAAKKVICDPYVTTVVRMEALAAGDLTSEIRYTENRDCVGRMTKAMATFQDNAARVALAAKIEAEAAEVQMQVVSALGAGLSQLADGDLTAELSDFPESYVKLEQDFNNAVVSLRETITALSTSSGGIRTGAGEIDQASSDLSRRTEQQAASLEETAAAMNEINATVKETADNAAKANDAVAQAKIDAYKSGEILQQTVGAMNGIERSSQEIGEIISVIDGIAFQTNLLALNAGVEAARAGDAGRGFAVVASEVRALAQRAAEAAKDVKSRITASSAQVENGVKLVGETGKSLERISERVNQVSVLVSDIATAAREQASSVQEVNSAISEMDSVTQRNAAMVEECTAAARSLTAEAEELVTQVGQFDLGDGVKGERLRGEARGTPRPAATKILRTFASGTHGNTALAVVPDEDWNDF